MDVSESRKKILYRTGQCSTHGQVEATKEIPKVSFPFLIWAVVRLRSTMQPYSCPECGAHVSAK